jgi:hypothetical protein
VGQRHQRFGPRWSKMIQAHPTCRWSSYVIMVSSVMDHVGRAGDLAYKFHAFDLLVEHSTDVFCYRGFCLAQTAGTASNPPNV